MTLSIYQVDAFTDTLFKGNPAAVCPLENWLPDATMQQISLENNLAETAFFVREGDNYHIRWFTPTVEVALCGHATIATAHVMHDHLHIADPVLTFNCKSGIITVEKKSGMYILNFPSDVLTKTNAPAQLIESLGSHPLEVYRGKFDYLLVFEDEQQIRQFEPDFNTLALVETRGIIVTAKGNDSDFVSRFFAPKAGINEDPVTGSAHTSLIPYWAKRLNKNMLFAKQVSSRGGELFCDFLGERVLIGGKAITYLEGKVSY